jgi:hypothetical protein
MNQHPEMSEELLVSSLHSIALVTINKTDSMTNPKPLMEMINHLSHEVRTRIREYRLEYTKGTEEYE